MIKSWIHFGILGVTFVAVLMTAGTIGLVILFVGICLGICMPSTTTDNDDDNGGDSAYHG